MLSSFARLFASKREFCPYCFELFHLRDTPFRCTSPAPRCPPEIDSVRERAWGGKVATPLGRVLPATGRFVATMSCPACKESSKKRLCPSCHMDLPHTVGEFRNVTLAIIGAKEAGKSHYLAVLIERLRNHVGPAMGFVLAPLNDHTIRRYNADFYDPLYRQKTVIRATASALADAKVREPLIYSLSFTGKGFLRPKRISQVVTVAFFDTAGEDLNDQDTLSVVNKYIYRSDGIILLLDPLQIEHVRANLRDGSALPSQNTETADIISRTTNLIVQGKGLSMETVIPIPLAIAFSKFDAVNELVDPQMQLNADAKHDGGYDLEDFEAVDGEMRALLESWHGRTITSQAEGRYKKVGYFGLTALGCNPHSTNKVPIVMPRRVEDPFLWLLHSHGLIATARRR